MKKGESVLPTEKVQGGFDIASLVLGILALLLVFLPWGPVLTFVFGLVGLVFGFIQKKRGQTRLGRAGIILNSLAIIVAVVVVIAAFIYLQQNPDALARLQQFASAP